VPWRSWAVAEEVKFNDFQILVQDQVIQVYAGTAARTTALGTAVKAGMFAHLLDNQSTEYYNGTAWVSISNPGDITAVTAGTALTGGGLSGAVTLDVNLAAVGSAVLATPALLGTVSTASTGLGFMGIPQNSTTTGAYTLVAADAGRHIYASATRTTTIPANSAVALPIGTTVVFVAGTGATMTIAITTDTLLLAGPGTTGSRTLAPFGIATAVKITATSWLISGNGLT